MGEHGEPGHVGLCCIEGARRAARRDAEAARAAVTTAADLAGWAASVESVASVLSYAAEDRMDADHDEHLLNRLLEAAGGIRQHRCAPAVEDATPCQVSGGSCDPSYAYTAPILARRLDDVREALGVSLDEPWADVIAALRASSPEVAERPEIVSGEEAATAECANCGHAADHSGGRCMWIDDVQQGGAVAQIECGCENEELLTHSLLIAREAEAHQAGHDEALGVLDVVPASAMRDLPVGSVFALVDENDVPKIGTSVRLVEDVPRSFGPDNRYAVFYRAPEPPTPLAIGDELRDADDLRRAGVGAWVKAPGWNGNRGVLAGTPGSDRVSAIAWQTGVTDKLLDNLRPEAWPMRLLGLPSGASS